jgi:dipeptidyl aminopeptidase/acylaminoacyl peptidase
MPIIRCIPRTRAYRRTAIAQALLASCAAAVAVRPDAAAARQPGFVRPTPVRQAPAVQPGPASAVRLTLKDVATADRWLGQEVRDVRWAPDGGAVYFRWHPEPRPDQDPDLDPWFRVDAAGRRVEVVPEPEVHRIPAAEPAWSPDARRAAWSSDGRLHVWQAGPGGGTTRLVHAGATPVRAVEFDAAGRGVLFMVDEDLYRYDIDGGTLARLTRRHVARAERRGPHALWLETEQRRLIAQHDRVDAREAAAAALRRAREAAAAALRRARDGSPAQPIPLPDGVRIDRVRLSPDGRFATAQWTRPNRERQPVIYADYVHVSGHTQAQQARAKVGEPRDAYGLAIVRVVPTAHADSIDVVQVVLPEAGGRPTIVHGPWWSLEGDRAVVQVLSQDHKDLWIAELDVATGGTRILVHLHDPAWLGGPPVQGGSLRPTLLEWLPGGRIVYASEQTGWSHLHLIERDGTVRALTEGEWEVRGARLSRDRTVWLIQASREHPADDHLYLMPAAGGALTRITEREGRSEGWLSPDGRRLAVVWSETVQLPDLFLRDARPGAAETRVTISGSERFHRHTWVRPEIVAFPHPDGQPVWAALYRPARPNAQRAAVLHIHGGGYRQFAHRGWSVYGFANHVGFLHWLLEQGYTVLDFDYRGSAGFGRDYRTDIYRSMGVKDVDGAVAAVEYLVREHGIDRTRIGMYGVSYGGFFTLMSLFRYPGVFAAGVSNDGVTDWAHYSDGWTSRILNLPHEDPEAYRVSSPIYHAEGLADPLLLVHSIIDDNVHFQDAARLTQRLIELEKAFDVMIYPLERHNFAHETSRYDYYRRVAAFFERTLLR